ncbi:SET domain-containing protein [Dentipellis sp. KUC8613]|nr:SET domain-containing protein [Dentipellis sp. KUC8613]
MEDTPVDLVKHDVESEGTPSVKTEPTPPPSMKQGSTPPADAKPVNKGPQLIGYLPRAEEAAMKTFVEIRENHYQYQTLGRSREALESMTCECVYDPNVDSPEDACGDDCINRLTQVECSPDDCRCRSFCRNQRFQRRQYAPIEIVQTEKKGFGLRAAGDLPRHTFIYEYVGDVISTPSFAKRMREYAEEGIRHFYFMALQKDEFIDATKRGGIGRFMNHSCNPNCYVAKWSIGSHVRIGIFANRKILRDEELTFNYNVDRYGHEAQTCYCGEAKCLGFIGGNTQTDIGAMDDLYLDALGISDEVDRLGLKGNKKKRGKKLDEDYVPILKPLVEKDIPKVIQAMRQTQSRKVLVKLLTRIKISEDESALRQLMRLRGFSLMTNVMDDYEDDNEIRLLAIECMARWPLISRNKVEDSKIAIPVEACTRSDNETLKKAAEELLEKWALLETAYRIPKRLKAVKEDSPSPMFYSPAEPQSRPIKRSRVEDLEQHTFTLAPPTVSRPPLSKSSVSEPSFNDKPTWFDPAAANKPKLDAAAIIAAAAAEQARQEAEAAAAAAKAAEEAAKKAARSKESKEERERRRRERKEKEKKRKADREANKNKRLLKLVGAVVVKCMSKYRSQMEVETFKKHAKELTHIIAEKEKKSSSYKENKLEALSDEKVNKIKKFAKEYINKVLHKLAKAGKLSKRPPDSSASASGPSTDMTGAPQTPGEHANGAGKEMTVEEAMDMSDDEPEPEHEHDDDDDDDEEDHDLENSPQDEQTPVEPAESDTSTAVVSDPRRRGQSSDEPIKAWDLHSTLKADILMQDVVPAVDAMEVGS